MTEAKFQAYKKFLIENGANEIIIEMPAIKELIKDILIDTYYRPENWTTISHINPNEHSVFATE